MDIYLDQFKSYWLRFSSQLSIEQDISQTLLNILITAYSEPQRAYHNVQHIAECLAHFQSIQSSLNDPIAVETAIWFHDVIYDPRASDNELQSAELMKQLCNTFLSEQQIEKVYQWIIATQKHQSSYDHDLNSLLDIDLAILGSSAERFAEYQQQIQFEYAWVESGVYQVKRKQLLQQFEQMNPIFQTSYFNQCLEKQAKRNLADSMS
mgnify:FL=1